MIRRLLAVVSDWVYNPRCPWCKERTPHLEAHMHTNHTGLPEQP